MGEVPWKRYRGGGAVEEDIERRSGGCWRGKIDKMRERERVEEEEVYVTRHVDAC